MPILNLFTGLWLTQSQQLKMGLTTVRATQALARETSLSLLRAGNCESYVQIVKFSVGLETATLHQNSKELCNNATKPIRLKTLMDKKKLLSQATRPGKRITIKDLPNQLVELPEKDLQQIVGGFAFGGMGGYEDR